MLYTTKEVSALLDLPLRTTQELIKKFSDKLEDEMKPSRNQRGGYLLTKEQIDKLMVK